MRKVKCFVFDFPSGGISVRVRALSLSKAIDEFKLIFGEMLFNEINCIWEK